MKTLFSHVFSRVLLIICIAIMMLVVAFSATVTLADPIVANPEAVAASFVDSLVSLPGVRYSSAQWGDCNNDSLQDVVIIGEISTTAKIAAVYTQDPQHRFSNVANLAGVKDGAVAWGDYNRDGLLDLALTGDNNNVPFSRIYRNTGGCTFVDSGAVISGVRYSSVAWGDYNNDGRPDLLITGDTGATPVTKLYRNNSGGFSDSGVQLPGVKNGAAVWGDYNRDGRLDILLTGAGASGSLTKILRNDGNGVFTDIQAPLTALNRGAASWGDYDNDGDLDVLLTGSTAAPVAVADIYRNNNGVFTKNASAGLTGSNDTWTTAAWADYNHDGLLDVLITSNNGTPTVYRNLGTGIFTDTTAGLPALSGGSAVWGDYDNDLQPDILLTGLDSTGRISRIYKSATIFPNAAPFAPTGLSARCSGSDARFSWLAATDDIITRSLTYNLRVGTQPGRIDIVAPLAAADGYRRVPAMGNAYTSLSAVVKNLPRGTYYWSVQAIDGALAGSSFAAEKSFIVPCEVYLPAVLKDYITYFEGPWEQEVNNTYDAANGPLRLGRAYYGRHNDTHDYFSVYLTQTGAINADMLTSLADGVQLQMFYQDTSHFLGYDFDSPFHLGFTDKPPGWYYILIFTDNRYLGAQTYTMTVTSP